MANNHFTLFQYYIFLSRYSRWLPDKNRRETWTETVARYFDFFEDHLKTNFNHDIKHYRKELEEAVLSLKVMPSMRCLMTAGEALKRENVAGYNCSYIPIDSPRSFDEILYVIMCGTGVGFSVEAKHTRKLPIIADEFYESDTTIVVADSRLGWAKALKELIHLLYSGQIPKWDTSKLRPAGSPLKTFGGRSSGPQAIEEVFKFCVNVFKKAAGRKLSTLECHDLVCKIAESIVVGGVRRSALISLSDLSDDRMRYAKSGQWWIENVQRALANNSAAYNEKPDVGIFMDEWKALYDSKSGERGIFNRQSAKETVERCGRRDASWDFGVNPCVVGDTEVDTNLGKMRVRDVVNLIGADRNDILIKSFSNQSEYRHITAAALTRENAEVIELEVATSLGTSIKLILTPDHKVFTENRGYVEAKDLTEDDELLISIT